MEYWVSIMGCKGTPKTLLAAIVNGLDACDQRSTTLDKAATIKMHVRDFLAQRFNVATLTSDVFKEHELTTLFEEIVNK